MRLLALSMASFALLRLCGKGTEAAMPAAPATQSAITVVAQHGGTVIPADDAWIELVTKQDGSVEAYAYDKAGQPLPAERAQITSVQIQGDDGRSHDVALQWDPAARRYAGRLEVRPVEAPAQVHVVVAGRPRRLSAPRLLVVAPDPALPGTVAVTSAPPQQSAVVVEAREPSRARAVVVTAPEPRPGAVVIAPTSPPPPGVVIAPPPAPGVVVAPGSAQAVVAAPDPRPGVVVVGTGAPAPPGGIVVVDGDDGRRGRGHGRGRRAGAVVLGGGGGIVVVDDEGRRGRDGVVLVGPGAGVRVQQRGGGDRIDVRIRERGDGRSDVRIRSR